MQEADNLRFGTGRERKEKVKSGDFDVSPVALFETDMRNRACVRANGDDTMLSLDRLI